MVLGEDRYEHAEEKGDRSIPDLVKNGDITDESSAAPQTSTSSLAPRTPRAPPIKQVCRRC